MKKIIFSLLLTLSISFTLLGNSNKKENNDLVKTVTLIDKLESSKTLILLNNENFTIKTSLTLFKKNIENWLIKHPHLEEDKELLDMVLKKCEKKDIVDVSKIVEKNGKFSSRLKFRLADLLQNGNCLVIDKKNNKKIDKIKVETYYFHCGELCGHGGRRFLIDKKIILEVMDWIS